MRYLLTALSLLAPLAAPHAPRAQTRPAPGPSDVRLTTIPHRVYKTNDGVETEAATESWVFHVVVKQRRGPPLEPRAATVVLYSGPRPVKTVRFGPEALAAARGVNFKSESKQVELSARYFAAQDETFDLRHSFTEPVKLKIDRLGYTLELQTPRGARLRRALSVPVSYYAQKAKLIFPLKGPFMVTRGHVTDASGHSEWSQHYAYDIMGLGPRYEPVRTNGETNEDFYGWGREVVAPGDGVVAYARNDVPDNKKPGERARELLLKLPEPQWAVAGNVVVIDHGGGEFSILGHLRQGSVRVKAGGRVRSGEVVGLMGNSGNSGGPHLHYHLMNGPALFRHDGLPSRFDNLEVPVPKRGSFLEPK
ncbi:MAG: M23 family metallopeptidase [Acidobacteriota bacterium]|nr:M23 family metallopeptidase [Acidobacteriota bacterium]